MDRKNRKKKRGQFLSMLGRTFIRGEQEHSFRLEAGIRLREKYNERFIHFIGNDIKKC